MHLRVLSEDLGLVVEEEAALFAQIYPEAGPELQLPEMPNDEELLGI